MTFDGGQITSDGGVVLLREVDRVRRLTSRFAECFVDARDPERISSPQFPAISLASQRRAMAQPRSTVGSDRPSTSAISGMVRPAKLRSSTIER